MIRVMVTYKVKAESVAENERLVRAVYEGLAEIGDPDIHYATVKKHDGQTFVHLGVFPSREAQAVLSNSPAFMAFQKDLADRCEIPPNPEPLELVGSWGLNLPVPGTL